MGVHLCVNVCVFVYVHAGDKCMCVHAGVHVCKSVCLYLYVYVKVRKSVFMREFMCIGECVGE